MKTVSLQGSQIDRRSLLIITVSMELSREYIYTVSFGGAI